MINQEESNDPFRTMYSYRFNLATTLDTCNNFAGVDIRNTVAEMLIKDFTAQLISKIYKIDIAEAYSKIHDISITEKEIKSKFE